MASLTKITETIRANKVKAGGRKRKRRLAKKSTASYEELFAEMGPPQEPTPKK